MSSEDTPKKINLNELYRVKRDALMNGFELARKHSTHAGTTGDASEQGWRAVLSDFLPRRYQVEKAIIVDSNGECSDQIDIVIYDRQYSPLVVKQYDLMYIPVESVYAIFEAKQAINKGHISYAGEKAQSVRRLHRTSVPIRHAGGEYPAKEPHRILAGIVTMDSDWSPPFGEAFTTAIKALHPDEETWLEIGCALNAGTFEVAYEGLDTPEITISQEDMSLMVFLFTLFERLRVMGTVPAIDLTSYGDWLDCDRCE